MTWSNVFDQMNYWRILSISICRNGASLNKCRPGYGKELHTKSSILKLKLRNECHWWGDAVERNQQKTSTCGGGERPCRERHQLDKAIHVPVDCWLSQQQRIRTQVQGTTSYHWCCQKLTLSPWCASNTSTQEVQYFLRCENLSMERYTCVKYSCKWMPRAFDLLTIGFNISRHILHGCWFGMTELSDITFAAFAVHGCLGRHWLLIWFWVCGAAFPEISAALDVVMLACHELWIMGHSMFRTTSQYSRSPATLFVTNSFFVRLCSISVREFFAAHIPRSRKFLDSNSNWTNKLKLMVGWTMVDCCFQSPKTFPHKTKYWHVWP